MVAVHRSDRRDLVTSGLPAVGAVPWGTHLCHFYRTREDLRDALVPYFQTGLQQGEQCLWVTSEPFDARQAREALAEVVPQLERYEHSRQIEIIDYSEWYLGLSGLSGKEVLEMWLEREQSARQSGFAGLRITGNTFWLEREDWESFAEYERAVHTAFRARNILALCSYSLNRCTMDDVLDVLQSHEFALLRRGGVWETIRSATELVDAVRTGGAPAHQDHRVYFYGDGRYPARSIASFLGEGLRRGEIAAAIATREHQSAIQRAADDEQIDLSGLRTFDADEVMATFYRDGRLDADALRSTLDQLLGELGREGQLYLYGEMVDLLCHKGAHRVAIELEDAWNEAMEGLSVTLFCGYSLSSFGNASEFEAYFAICGAHAEVQIDADHDDQSQLVKQLITEFGRRRDWKPPCRHQHRLDQEASRRMAMLQNVTAALSEAKDIDQLQTAIERDVCRALGAEWALVSRSGDATSPAAAILCRIAGRDGAWHRFYPAEDSGPSAGQSAWLRTPREVREHYLGLAGATASLAVTPLKVAGRRIGRLFLGFRDEQPFEAVQRAVIDDVACQVALTVDRILLFQKAKAQREQIERASRAKDDFLAMLSHELRNPLSAIQSASELLKAVEPDGNRLRQTQAILERQVGHMAKLLDGLLDVSRMVRGKIKIERKPLDLVSVIHNTLSDRASEIERRGIELCVDDRSGESQWVDGDGLRLTQIFDNLLSNALKFTASGGSILVSIRRDQDTVIVSIQDTGIGIDTDLLPSIFEPFQQGTQELARTTGGLGLGLAVVKGLVEGHGGQVVAKSAGRGQGATFEVRLPRIERCEPEEADASPAATAARVLVVEDNRDAADLLGELLRANGHEAMVSYDGDQALDMARAFKPTLLLCDIGLPGKLSGYDLARLFRKELELRGACLVALTGYGRPEDQRRAKEAGFDEHLTKPIDMLAFERLIANHLGDR